MTIVPLGEILTLLGFQRARVSLSSLPLLCGSPTIFILCSTVVAQVSELPPLKSFVEVLSAPSLIFSVHPVYNGWPSHYSDQEIAYEQCLQLCKDSLIGRVFLEKGDKP